MCAARERREARERTCCSLKQAEYCCCGESCQNLASRLPGHAPHISDPGAPTSRCTHTYRVSLSPHSCLERVHSHSITHNTRAKGAPPRAHRRAKQTRPVLAHSLSRAAAAASISATCHRTGPTPTALSRKCQLIDRPQRAPINIKQETEKQAPGRTRPSRRLALVTSSSLFRRREVGLQFLFKQSVGPL